MKKLNFYLCLSLLLMIGYSCSNDDDTVPAAYVKTVIPTSIEDLYEAKGQIADTVIVYSPGGPIPNLDTGDIEEPQFQNYYRVYVKQAQHINSTIVNNTITFEQAITEDNISTEMYFKVLKHFKDSGKTVIAMSHSFGSFILPNVIVNNPNIADKVVIMAGRLDMPDVVWQGFRDGKQYSFPGGINPTLDSGSPETGGELSATRLQAGLGKNRYTQLLANKDISNLLYVFGLEDVAVGRLTTTERDFLVNKDAVVFEINGDHNSMFESEILDIILDAIRQ